MQYIRKILNIAQQNLRVCNTSDTTCKRPGLLLQNIVRFNHDFERSASLDTKMEEDEYTQISNLCLDPTDRGHRVFILQPFIKWGRDKKRNTSPELQMAESVALINTLRNWYVVGTKFAPLLTLQKTPLLGTGAMEDLKKQLHQCENSTAIFVSTNHLKFAQITMLEKILGLPIYDRYSIVVHIFREHAVTVEAKLQVSLAEIPYIRKKLFQSLVTKCGAINITEKTKLMLDRREKKLKNELTKLQQHRKVIRSQRKSRGFPTIAVVGYTNAGKTSLIKALTNDDVLKPRNELFATLDTTAHEGMLPCKLKVLYMDTIGFIQDVPETLIEPFVVTLEDAIIAVYFSIIAIIILT